MSNKELYKQKKQAQLDEWRADIDKLKAKAAGASADAKLEMNKKIQLLENKMKEGKAKLAELADASDEAWETFKDGVETSWDSLKTAVSDAVAKLK